MTRHSFAILSSCCVLAFAAVPLTSAGGYWPFDGDLRDHSGQGHDAYPAMHAPAPQFVPGQQGQALLGGREPVQVPDRAELRLAPGLRIGCRLRFDTLPPGGYFPVVIKEKEYMLRVNPPEEGRSFGFFLHMDGWERRVQSAEPVRTGVWYEVEAAWDGSELTLAVNGDVTRQERTGTPKPSATPLALGAPGTILDEVRIENPNAAFVGVANWPFDGDLRDRSGREHDFAAENPRFAQGRKGQALQAGPEALSLPDHPDFQLEPGLHIECAVRFDQMPAGIAPIVMKDGEYQLRVNPPQEGSRLAFFVNLDGWEPRVTAGPKVEPGVWYHIIAQWDGLNLSLMVNGDRQQTSRAGLARPTANPLTVGPLPGIVDELRIENPRLPVLRLDELEWEHSLLRAGRPERISTTLRNYGSPAENCTVTLELPPGAECLGPAAIELGSFGKGDEKPLEWTVRAPGKITATATLRLTGDGLEPVLHRRLLPFFPATDPAHPTEGWTPPEPAATATTYYVDSAAGNNANPGTSPATPWRDFTNINGRTLGPGERLLIKRGSVINQELVLSAEGTPEAWAEIGAYGSGPRPAIRRNWHIADRCALVRNPSFLRIRSLRLSHAAQGLVVNYSKTGHRGLLIEDCIAHHIEGLYRFNSHGIPEWRGHRGPEGGGLNSSAGIAIVGAAAEDLVVRDCEMFQCSWGFFVKGDGVIVDRVYCHDNFAYNTSPHPAMVAVRRSYLQNSIFDASGYHASAGTMGIMLVDTQGFIIRNCLFQNQPDSGSHDQGGIDFENRGNGCLIDRCTFRNNAGAAIEVLGLKAPQTRNIEIANSRFFRNNTAIKLGPAEIYIWGKSKDPMVCCSTGVVHGNGYVLHPGVEFFVNEAPKTTRWTLHDNTEYASPEALDQAMPFNNPPAVAAGPDIWTDQPTVPLAGTVADDGRSGQPLTIAWEVLDGPGPVAFADPAAATTSATFAVPGDYLLRLVADDGELWLSDLLHVHLLPPGTTVAKAWSFNTNLDKEGWTEANLGTKTLEWPDQQWASVSHPVKYVAGGHYLVAIEETVDAHLLSPAAVGLDLDRNRTLRIRFQNHTPATHMRLRFTTETNPAWDDARAHTFTVVANDNAPREYTLDMAAVPGWNGKLDQLRLDLATGTPLTGTCRIDYLWIGSQPGQ